MNACLFWGRYSPFLVPRQRHSVWTSIFKAPLEESETNKEMRMEDIVIRKSVAITVQFIACSDAWTPYANKVILSHTQATKTSFFYLHISEEMGLLGRLLSSLSLPGDAKRLEGIGRI
jgi:hypothetical protein